MLQSVISNFFGCQMFIPFGCVQYSAITERVNVPTYQLPPRMCKYLLVIFIIFYNYSFYSLQEAIPKRRYHSKTLISNI